MVRDGAADVHCGHLTYTLLIPGVDQQRLARLVGETVEFHTLHYLEGQGQGANYLPRLIGFASPEDRAFFEVFTTVKGIGNRKALRALQLPFAQVAEAIAGKDVDTLTSLPEIGKRTAETIIAELSGKVDRFLSLPESAPGRPARAPAVRSIADDAIAVLTSLGEPKLAVMQLVDRALTADPAIGSSEELIAAVYRLKAAPV